MAVRTTTSLRHAIARRVSAFARAEDGSFIILTIFFFAAIFLVGGVVVDLLRHDYQRTQLQTTLDNAVLAAADLDQSLDPESVVADYFAKAGLAEALTDIQVTSRVNSRTVSADAEMSLPTLFMHALGVNDLGGAASATAREDIRDIEISMVLDVSGSMGLNNKIQYLKAAAKDFVGQMLLDANGGPIENEISINVVPYATQVSAGADILSAMNVTHEHGYSYCLDFSAETFAVAGMSSESSHKQTAHFDSTYTLRNSGDRKPDISRLQCRTDIESRAMFVSDDLDALNAKIDSLWARGNTSIEVGMKWGIGLLDPEMRPVMSSLPGASESFKDRPFDYGRDNTMKVLIVMTDGANTTQHSMKSEYSGGTLSDIWKYEKKGSLYYSIASKEPWDRDRDGDAGEDYYVPVHDVWVRDPVGGDAATQLTWAQVWAEQKLTWHAYYGRGEQESSSGSRWKKFETWYYDVFEEITGSEKDTRLSTLCSAIHDRNVIVFTIAFDISESDSKVLKSCATTPNHYYNVTGSQISYAFSSIAGTINQLQLVE